MVGPGRRAFLSMVGLWLAQAAMPVGLGRASENEAGLVPMDIPAGSANLDLPDLDGTIHGLAEYAGRVTIVSFWATWCPPCRKEMPSLARLTRKLPAGEFAVLAVNIGDDRERVIGFLDTIEHDGLTVLLDEKIRMTSQWYLRGLPATYVLDANGDVRLGAFGERVWDSPEMTAAIMALASS